MSLNTLVDSHNRMDKMFGDHKGQNQWSVKPDAKMAQEMFQRLDSNLSPEVVYQDGERRGAAAQRYAAQQRAAVKELKALGFTLIGATYNL